MRRRSMVIGAVLALALFGGGLTAQAHLRDEMRPGMVERPETIVLQGGPQTFHELDLGDPGPSRGDRLYVEGDVFRDGRRVGHSLSICEQFTQEIEFGRRGRFYCENELHIIGRGTLLAVGFQDVSNDVIVDPILGGTGEFRNARGQITVDFSVGEIRVELLP